MSVDDSLKRLYWLDSTILQVDYIQWEMWLYNIRVDYIQWEKKADIQMTNLKSAPKVLYDSMILGFIFEKSKEMTK